MAKTLFDSDLSISQLYKLMVLYLCLSFLVLISSWNIYETDLNVLVTGDSLSAAQLLGDAYTVLNIKQISAFCLECFPVMLWEAEMN